MTDLSGLPRVDMVLEESPLPMWILEMGRSVVVEAVRAAVDAAREQAVNGAEVPTAADIAHTVDNLLALREQAQLQRVVNATGVLLHTNLGRAPLSNNAMQAVADAGGACSIELDLDTGRRGSRTAHVGRLVADLFGTEDATVVNNGAAALMLTLSALATGGHTIVSRGELIEIGGSYRLPDVITATGTTMVEVGTTNRTHARDYEAALARHPAAIVLKVHPSNYEVAGFTAATGLAELRPLADKHEAIVVADLGSGLLTDHDGVFADEPSVAAALRDGADLVICSGDKLLGGPQAGIIAGRADLVERCRRHPLARAVRIDKLQRAAFESTIESHLRDPGGLTTSLPLGAMLALTVEELRRRAESVLASLQGHAGGELDLRVSEMDSVVGGGTLPGRTLPSVGLTIKDPSGDLTARLRVHGVIARLQQGICHLDLRTVTDGPALVRAIEIVAKNTDGPWCACHPTVRRNPYSRHDCTVVEVRIDPW